MVKVIEAVRTVIVMRHCLRSCPDVAKGGEPGFDWLSNYTDPLHPFDPWPVDDYMCLPRGIELVEAIGKALEPTLPPPILIEADSAAQRDIDTAAALMRGLGLDERDMVEAPCLFDPTAGECGYCDGLDVELQQEAIQARLEEFPKPENFQSLIEDFQAFLGAGSAPAMGEISDYVDGLSGYYSGGTSIASQISEYMLMKLAGNETIWGDMTKEDVYDYLETHVYYRGVQDRALPLNLRDHSYMAQELLYTLKGSEDHLTGTRVMVGHDGDLDAIASIFGLEWFTPPFPANATTPGSSVRFDVDEVNNVKVTVQYQAFDGGEELLFADGTWTWAERRETVSLQELNEVVGGKLSEECMPP